RAITDDVHDLTEISRRLLHRNDRRDLGQGERRARFDVAAGATRHVVHDYGQVDGVGDRAEMRDDPALRRLVVHRAHVQQVGGARGAHFLGERDGFARVVRPRARDDRYAAAGFVCDDLHHAAVLGHGHRGGFARRSAWHKKVYAFGDLPRDDRSERALVDRAIARERGGERGAAPEESRRGRHARGTSARRKSRIVYTPRRPMSQRAAASAPSANTRRSRASCTTRICSNAASSNSSWVPGTAPTRTLLTGMSLPKASVASRCSARAVPDGASRLAAWWVSTMCAS